MFNKILILLLLQFFLLTGLWAIDIGASGMVWEAVYSEAEAVGLGFSRGASTQYHLGLLIIYIVFFIQLSWILFMILNQKDLNS